MTNHEAVPPEEYPMSDRLIVALRREPLVGADIADRFSITETADGCLVIADDTQRLYLRQDQAESFANGVLRFLDHLDADRKRYVRIRDRVGRAVRQNLSEFEDTRIEIETVGR